MFRFRNLKKYSIAQATEGVLEPRISQIFAPLLSLVTDEKERNEILEIVQDYSRELSLDRSTNIELYVMEIIKSSGRATPCLPLHAISAKLNERCHEEFQETISGKRVGFIVGKLLNIRTRKTFRNI